MLIKKACWKNSTQSQSAEAQVPLRGGFAGFPGFLGEPAGHLFSGCHQPGFTHSRRAVSRHITESLKLLAPNAFGYAIAHPP